MMNEAGGTMEMPIGMAMSMAQNPDAMKAFCRLSDKERAELISRARTVHNRDEMTNIINELAEKG